MKLILLFLLIFNPLYAAQTTLYLGTSHHSPITSSNQDGVIDLILQELAQRLEIEIIIDPVGSGERVLLNANNGVIDGDVGRVLGLERLYPNLISIPIPIYHYEMVVFSKNITFKVTGKESIMPYNIGVLRGWKILETISTGAAAVTNLENAEQMFNMLDKNRIDIAPFEKNEGLVLLKKMGLKDIKALQPSLLEGDFHLYLHKKHKNLIPEITEEFSKMQHDGTIEYINKTVLKKHLNYEGY